LYKRDEGRIFLNVVVYMSINKHPGQLQNSEADQTVETLLLWPETLLYVIRETMCLFGIHLNVQAILEYVCP
jgi:hypothetical protein